MTEHFDVVDRLKQFNTFFDKFILTAAKPLSMVGFAMGTVDIFNRGGMATNPFFAFGWSLVQAVTIDGLFFAVWYRIFERGKLGWRRVWLTFIGIVLAFVVWVTNGILGFQQLWGVGDSQTAMIRLGVDPGAFTMIRAVLVVAVAIMVAFVYQSEKSATPPPKEVTEEVDQVTEPAGVSHRVTEGVTAQATEVTEVTQPLTEIPEHVTDPDDELADLVTDTDGSLTDDHSKAAILAAMQKDPTLNLTRLAKETGIPRTTLRDWRSKIRTTV